MKRTRRSYYLLIHHHKHQSELSIERRSFDIGTSEIRQGLRNMRIV